MGGNVEVDLPLVVIDLNENDQLQIAQQLREACIGCGFFYLINHGIDLELMDKVFEQSKLFFDLPLEEKMKLLHDKNHRGYTPLAEEAHNPSTSKQGDSRESYFIGLDIPDDHPLGGKPLHGPNQWPAEDLLPEYRETMEKYFYLLLEVGHRVASLVALALDLEEDYFQHMFKAPIVALRPLHYAAETSCPGGRKVCRDTDAELKVWEDVPPKRGAFIVNLGDMLERWTNGLFRSTHHRVVTDGVDRYSVPFFYDPDYDVLIECLPTCSSHNFPSKYPPITIGDYFVEKFKARMIPSSTVNAAAV